MWQFDTLLAHVDLCSVVCLQSDSKLVVCSCKYEDSQTLFALCYANVVHIHSGASKCQQARQEAN